MEESIYSWEDKKVYIVEKIKSLMEYWHLAKQILGLSDGKNYKKQGMM